MYKNDEYIRRVKLSQICQCTQLFPSLSYWFEAERLLSMQTRLYFLRESLVRDANNYVVRLVMHQNNNITRNSRIQLEPVSLLKMKLILHSFN